MLLRADERQLAEKGISNELVLKQVERFKKGFESIILAKAATVDDGILRLSSSTELDSIGCFEEFEGSLSKFVPASGAATRMFKGLFEFRERLMNTTEEVDLSTASKEILVFFQNLRSFAFYDDLKKAFEKTHDKSIDAALRAKEYAAVLSSLLENEGLGYGNLPKGLLAFHQYGQERRTPAIEQVGEGRMHIPQKSGFHLHFTVSPEFEEMFQKHLKASGSGEERSVEISYSSQEPATDKIAVDLSNETFRDDDGQLLFRPAGHGALLRNLNRIEEDMVFIKNIDNVLPDHLKEEVVHFKKVIAGVLLQYQRKIFDLLERRDRNENIESEARNLLLELGTDGDFSIEEIVNKLNRPLRVCGMVKNVGEPGGGPFWVKEKDGHISTQIVEKAQVDLDDEDQQKTFDGATHFNPVDIVCALKNRHGEKYDLLKFRDDETGFITEKSHGGRKLKAMELPGLWNGGMADWNTVFVEVPLSTFSPVKTVNDLLKDEHRSNGG